MTIARLVVGAFVLASTVVGCQSSDVERHTIPASDLPPPSPRPRAPVPTAEPIPTNVGPIATASNSGVMSSTGDAGAAPGELGWTVPSKWATAPNPSAMRKATYKIPKAAGDTEDAEMSVTLASGAIDANVDRWSGQFEDSKTTRTERALAGGVKVTIVEIRGR